MGYVAGRRLLRLGELRLLVPDQRRAERDALVGDRAQRVDVKDRGDAFDLDDAPVQRHPAVQGGRTADQAVAADHRGLDQLSVRQTDDQRDGAAVREVDPVDALTRVEQQVFVDQFERLELRQKEVEVLRIQRCQETIGVTCTHCALPL